MIFPNKIIRLEDSTIFKSKIILEKLEVEEMEINKLLKKTKKKFDDIDEFIMALEVLYFLGMISLNEDRGVIEYVKENNM